MTPPGAVAQEIKAGPPMMRTLSNREYLATVSALVGKQLPLDLEKSWTPSTQFSGFDAVPWPNLDTKAVRVEMKWAQDTKWYPITVQTFRPVDAFTWPQWKPEQGRGLDVRVLAKDLAGHETVSRIVRIPSTEGDLLTGTPGRSGNRPDPFNTPSGGFVQPEIRYVNTLDTTVQYTIAKMGRSGVRAVHLWASDDQRTWKKANTFPVNAPYNPEKPSLDLSLPYKAEKEGLYGFIVIPEGGGGIKAADPKRDDPPMVLVSVDTQPPYAGITAVQVAAGAKGPRVEISWRAVDPNLLARPVNLEYATDKNKLDWKPVALQTENNLSRETGRFVWEIPDERLWKFYLRLRVVDKATNIGEHVWGVDLTAEREKGAPANPPAEWKEVIVDLVQPEATIKDVRSDGTPGAGRGPAATPPSPKPTPPPKKGTGPAVPSLEDGK
jgi:hypothetical protein